MTGRRPSSIAAWLVFFRLDHKVFRPSIDALPAKVDAELGLGGDRLRRGRAAGREVAGGDAALGAVAAGGRRRDAR